MIVIANFNHFPISVILTFTFIIDFIEFINKTNVNFAFNFNSKKIITSLINIATIIRKDYYSYLYFQLIFTFHLKMNSIYIVHFITNLIS